MLDSFAMPALTNHLDTTVPRDHWVSSPCLDTAVARLPPETVTTLNQISCNVTALSAWCIRKSNGFCMFLWYDYRIQKKTQHQQWFPGSGVVAIRKQDLDRKVHWFRYAEILCISMCIPCLRVSCVIRSPLVEQHNMQAESTQIHPQLNLRPPTAPQRHKLLGPLCSYPTYPLVN